jgi:DNA polymerase-4
VFLPVDAEAYLAASRTVMDTLRTFPGVVQEAGWDEAFLAVESEDPESLAREIQRSVLERTKLWCSIGVGDSKLRAKMASGFAKPRGVFRLTRDNWDRVMGARAPAELWGIGRKTAAKLTELGIHTVDDLARAGEETLSRRFGPNTGPWLRELATGEGGSPVTDEPYVPRGHGRERTFQQDLTDPEEIRRGVADLARELMEDLRKDGRPVIRVIVKVRFAPFFTSTHGAKLPEPTRDERTIVTAALEALERFELDRPVRLLGVRAEFTKTADVSEIAGRERFGRDG